MKTRILIPTLSIAALLSSPAADPIVIDGPHNCCNGCKNAIIKALDGARDISVDEKKGTITAKGKSDAKKAVEILMENGFYATFPGATKTESKSSGSSFGSSSSTAAKKLKSATVTGVHNCCLKCRNMIVDAVREVPGVTGAEVEEKASAFTVKGEFSKDDLLAALHKAGFNGKIK